MLSEILDVGSVAAAEAVNATPLLPSTPVVGGGDIVSLLASTLVIVAVIVVLGWLYSRSRFVGGGSSDVINVVASRALGAKERLLVVEVAGQQLLVGMTANGVQTLHVFDEPVLVSKPGGDAGGFASRLRGAIREIGK
jgi:flagellar protein FliO/FliZ